MFAALPPDPSPIIGRRLQGWDSAERHDHPGLLPQILVRVSLDREDRHAVRAREQDFSSFPGLRLSLMDDAAEDRRRDDRPDNSALADVRAMADSSAHNAQLDARP